MPGIFITFEGLDGCGKTTQLALLAEDLQRRGYRVTITREPGGTIIGDRIRVILLDPQHQGITPVAELLLYAASRTQHLHEVILPALKRGDIVLCDRYTDATDAYQGGARKIDQRLIDAIHSISTSGKKPDLTILLDSPVPQALSRATARIEKNGGEKEARFEQEQNAFHTNVRDAYLAIAKKNPARVKVVDASGEIEAIHRRIIQLVEEVLSQCGIRL